MLREDGAIKPICPLQILPCSFIMSSTYGHRQVNILTARELVQGIVISTPPFKKADPLQNARSDKIRHELMIYPLQIRPTPTQQRTVQLVQMKAT